MNKLYLLVCVLLVISCAKQENQGVEKMDEQPQASFLPGVIYGQDNRLDYYQINDPRVLALADSSVALVRPSDIQSVNNGVTKLLGDPYGSAYQLCSSEPYREQITAAFCSGSLVASDVILTAGHCVTNAFDCTNVRFVFGYAQRSPSQTSYDVSSSEIYSCSQVIHTQAPGNGADFALIKLDRHVTHHRPLNLRTSGSVQTGEPLFVIGHPTGLPQKVAGGANVRSVSTSGYFVANLDTYGGNSGSPVFNANTFLLEGVLVRGENDFVQQGACQVSNQCGNTNCRGEDVTKISEVLNYLSGQVSPPPQTEQDKEETFTSTPGLSIPDNNKIGITSSISIPVAPEGRKVLVHLYISHSWIGDLVIKLTSPDGKSVVLKNREGGNRQDIRGIIGADLSSNQSFDSLSQVTATGEWKLQVFDLAARDAGKLLEWSVIFKP